MIKKNKFQYNKNPKNLKSNYKYLLFRRTKIIATIGPSSSDAKILKELILKGLNIARINFSHGVAEEHLTTISNIRKISNELNKPVAIIGDLCGPKIRVGKFKNDSILLKESEHIFITTKNIIGDETIIPSQYKNLIEEIKIGENILLDDGNLELNVVNKFKDKIEAVILRGGILKNNKGMNLPNTKLNISALTEKDKNDVKYCIKGEVDYIALSFVRKASDIIELKNLLKSNNSDIPVIAKIEKPEALNNIEQIIEKSDAIMIARGDLGVELPPQRVPIIQNKLINITNKHNKPVIVATQMLESMIEHSRPTRAEVTDVANACLNGADAVMLSGETAVGKYPIETLEIMDLILREAEAYQYFGLGGKFKKVSDIKKDELENAIAAATAQLSRDLIIRCVLALTRTGFSARIISSDRPAAPIIALTQSEKVFRRLNLLWGVYPFLVNKELKLEEYVKVAENIIKEQGLGKKNDYVIMLSGLLDKSAPTNSIIIHRIS